MDTNLMTVQEVADLLRISRFSVYNMVKRGELSAMMILNKLRFNHQNIEHYLNKNRINAA
jgi:putative molybdopterin biosynthesis protein